MTARRSASRYDLTRWDRPAVVLLDANALFLPFTSPLRLPEAVFTAVGVCRVVVPTSVRAELGRLERRGAPNASGAAALADRFPLESTEQRGDLGVRDVARRIGAWVVTADRALKERLRNEGVPVLFPRGRTTLAVALPTHRPEGRRSRPPSVPSNRSAHRPVRHERGPREATGT